MTIKYKPSGNWPGGVPDDELHASRVLDRVASFATADDLSQAEQDALFLRACDEVAAEIGDEMRRLAASVGPRGEN